jgi:hypothetical protein
LKSYILLELRLLDGHPVPYTFHTVYFVDEFGDQVLFGRVIGLSIHRDHPSEAIVCDSSMRFAEKTFIRVMMRIMTTVIANGLPIAEGASEVLIHYLITVD